MTKLMQWLFVIFTYGVIYGCLLTNVFGLDLTDNIRTLVVVSPVILIGLFGIYSVMVIMYRVATFNDCEDAATELKQQIEEARKDLSSKGIKFD